MILKPQMYSLRMIYCECKLVKQINDATTVSLALS